MLPWERVDHDIVAVNIHSVEVLGEGDALLVGVGVLLADVPVEGRMMAEARHQFMQSLFHRDRDFCGTCHDVSNPAVGDLAHNNGAQATADPVIADGSPGAPVGGKAAFNNPPYKYGIVERTFSEYKAGLISQTRVSAYATLPAELQGGALEAAYNAATQGGTISGDYENPPAPRFFSCQTCHMRDGDHEVRTPWGFLAVRLPLPEDEQWKADQVTILQALGVLDPEGNPTGRLDVVKAADVARLTQEAFDAERGKMLAVCGDCHSENFAKAEMEKGDDMIREADHLLANPEDVTAGIKVGFSAEVIDHCAGGLGGFLHGTHPRAAEGSYIDDQGAGETNHSLHFVFGMGHDGRGSGSQEHIGRIIHDHVVGNVMDKWFVLSNFL